MAMPITTPNYRHLINKMSLESCPVEGGATFFFFFGGGGGGGSVSEILECSFIYKLATTEHSNGHQTISRKRGNIFSLRLVFQNNVPFKYGMLTRICLYPPTL